MYFYDFKQICFRNDREILCWKYYGPSTILFDHGESEIHVRWKEVSRLSITNIEIININIKFSYTSMLND